MTRMNKLFKRKGDVKIPAMAITSGVNDAILKTTTDQRIARQRMDLLNTTQLHTTHQ